MGTIKEITEMADYDIYVKYTHQNYHSFGGRHFTSLSDASKFIKKLEQIGGHFHATIDIDYVD